jgi:hypothetical protein
VRHTEVQLSDVKIALSSHPNPDFFISAKRVELEDSETVVLHGLRLSVSGFDWLSWPRLKRHLNKPVAPLSFSTPQLQVDREFGLAVKQGVTFNLDEIHTEALLDYSPSYGLLAKSHSYIEPRVGTRLGIKFGRGTLSNIQRDTVQLKDNYNLVLGQDFNTGGALQTLKFDAEYGHVHEKIPGRPGAGIPDRIVEDDRFFNNLDLQFRPVALGAGWYFSSAARARFVRYESANDDYSTLGASAGVVLRQDGFDHFVIYRYNQVSGEPLFSIDEVRREQLDFATSFQAAPRWRNVVRGSYDTLDEDFDRLQLGTLKQQRSYELGLYWDFARESAELAFQLRLE